MKRAKPYGLILIVVLLVMLMTGCQKTETPAPMPSETAAATDAAPSASAYVPSVTDAASSAPQAAAAPFDWLTGGMDVEGRISQFSEVSETRAIVNGTTCLVGVKFAAAYQGEMTSRLHDMIAGEILTADPSIQTVAVTSEAADVDKIYEISDKIRAGQSAADFSADIDAIIRNPSTLS